MKTLSSPAALTVQTRITWSHAPIPVITLENGRIRLVAWVDSTSVKVAA